FQTARYYIIDHQVLNMTKKFELSFSNLEMAKIENDADLSAEGALLWDQDLLYIKADVTDQSIVVTTSGPEIYKTDILELYINPDGRGLEWGKSKDFQIGITPPDLAGQKRVYAWFQ